MKLQIVFAVAALIAVSYFVGFRHLQTSDPSVALVAAPVPNPPAPAPAAHKIQKRFQAPLVQEPEEAAAEPVEQAQEPMPEMLKWENGHKPEDNSGPQITTTETVRPEDGALITITYGDLPKPNVKLEHRDFVASGAHAQSLTP